MQRRATAISVAFFIIVGALSYSLIATANEPTVSFENPEYRLSQGETFTLDGETYNVTTIEASMEGGGGGGHGGGGPAHLVRSGEIAWTNESSRYTLTWEANQTIDYQDKKYNVSIPNADDPSVVRLREDINETQILQNDPQAEDELVVRNGTQYVAFEENGNITLVPASEYFPEPGTITFREGETFSFQGNQTTVANVTTQAATLEWTAPRTNAVSVSDLGNVTLSNTTYLASFPNNNTMVLTQNFQSLEEQQQEIHAFETHKQGLWFVFDLCLVATILLLSMAYLPSRY
jgi:hypothetical protein